MISKAASRYTRSAKATKVGTWQALRSRPPIHCSGILRPGTGTGLLPRIATGLTMSSAIRSGYRTDRYTPVPTNLKPFCACMAFYSDNYCKRPFFTSKFFYFKIFSHILILLDNLFIIKNQPKQKHPNQPRV